MRLFGEHAYMAVDFPARSLTMIGRDNGVPIPGIDGARMETTTWPEHDAIAAEHEAFMAAILDGAPVLVDAAAGRRALAAGSVSRVTISAASPVGVQSPWSSSGTTPRSASKVT